MTRDYNTARPHRSLGQQTPAEYAAKIAKETKELAEVVAAADIKAE